MTKRKIPRVGDTVEVIKFNDSWLEIDDSIQYVIGEYSEVFRKSKFKEIGTRFQIIIKDKTIEDEIIKRSLWLPAEWLRIV